VVGSAAELPAVDGIVVAAPTRLHAEIVEGVLERGVPIYVEKPLAVDPADADRVAADGADLVFVMDKWRYHPGVELLAQIARSGELGKIVGLRSTRNGWGNPHDVDAVWILAPHDLSIGIEILGELPRPSTAIADSVDGYGNGLIGLLGGEPWLALEVSARSIERRREITLLCELGVAKLSDGYSDRVLVARQLDRRDTRPPEPESRPISTEMPLMRELRAFVEHVRGGPPPRSSAAEGAAIVRAIFELRALAALPQ
jgi:predicted dehydrogenase